MKVFSLHFHLNLFWFFSLFLSTGSLFPSTLVAPAHFSCFCCVFLFPSLFVWCKQSKSLRTASGRAKRRRQKKQQKRHIIKRADWRFLREINKALAVMFVKCRRNNPEVEARRGRRGGGVEAQWAQVSFLFQ